MGDRGLLLEFGDEISREISEKVRRMALAVQAEGMEGIAETVPTYRSLLIVYNPAILPIQGLKKRLNRVEEGLQQTPLPEPKLTPCFIIFGTAHAPMENPFCLTRKDFVTPLGTLNVDKELVWRARSIGSWSTLRAAAWARCGAIRISNGGRIRKPSPR